MNIIHIRIECVDKDAQTPGGGLNQTGGLDQSNAWSGPINH